MKLRLLIKGDAIQFAENDFYCPCRTIDIAVAGDLIDKAHEHIVGVEIEPQESRDVLEKVSEEIAFTKRNIQSENSDYLTGYVSALSGVEGVIAEVIRRD